MHVFVPLFPDPGDAGDDADADEDDDEEMNDTDDEDEEQADLRPAFLRQKRKRVAKRKAQYASGHRQILVSHPRLNAKVNRELFEVAGLPFPYDNGSGGLRGERGSDAESDVEPGMDADDDDEDEAWEGEQVKDEDTTLGAGEGVISSAGSSLNHVVSISWSPSGLGRNRRPVLAVLTSAGYIGFYGDGASAAKTRGGGFTSIGRGDDTLRQRDLSSWAVLFGAGERFVVPGQQVDVTERVASIAWAKEIAPGQALLAYANDAQEVVVLSIQSMSVSVEDMHASTSMKKEETTWRVQEVARFKAQGPHPQPTPWDVDWAPCNTCFGLTWSPWLSAEGSRTCLLSNMDRNYVGFRKITLKTPWTRGTDPEIAVDQTDAYGKCVNLSTDGFVQFEDAIWTKGQSKVVRGIVVTGFHAKPFEVSITGPQPSPFQPVPHSTNDCGTTYLDPAVDRMSCNPIVDLIIHPPNMATPTDIPTYSLVRLSATSTNHDWFQTNATLPDLSSSRGISEVKPQWAVDLAQKLAILVPADAHMRHTAGEDDGSDADSAASDKGPGDIDSADELTDDDDEVDLEKVTQAPEVHPARYRLHGLAAAPGGKATVVLASAHSTQTPDRIGWFGLRSVLLFGSVGRPKRRSEENDRTTNPSLLRLTTEGRMLNWMYGAGPDVPGITTDLDDGSDSGTDSTKAMFKDAIVSQSCDFCGQGMAVSSEPDGRLGMSICRQGHFFSTCGASGLAIQAPGISHTCGVCGVQTLKVEELLKKAPALEERIKGELTADVCGNCGGKFVD